MSVFKLWACSVHTCKNKFKPRAGALNLCCKYILNHFLTSSICALLDSNIVRVVILFTRNHSVLSCASRQLYINYDNSFNTLPLDKKEIDKPPIASYFYSLGLNTVTPIVNNL